MKSILRLMAMAAIVASAPAAAQVQAGIHVGMQVTDAAGAPVGTVASIQGANLLVKTDKHEALLPATSFRAANGKLLFGMSQAQLDTQIEQQIAAANSAIAAGATVKGIGGTRLGIIESVAGGNATITLEDGKKIAVPQQGLRGNADGTVTIGYSAAQLKAMVQGDASPTEASTTNSSAADTPGQ